MIDLLKLFAEFPRDQITWRAQSVTKDGSKAMALAYIDARDVMNRLDDVCGIDGWQRRYSHANGKTICEIGIRCGHEWIWKADGAGDTDIEAEKGAISDAFKRAAVNWGVGRYLYDLPCPWVPCKSYESGGKWKWSEFTESPWNYVKTAHKHAVQTETAAARNKRYKDLLAEIDAAYDTTSLMHIWQSNQSTIMGFRAENEMYYEDLVRVKDRKKKEITDREIEESGYSQGFNATTNK